MSIKLVWSNHRIYIKNKNTQKRNTSIRNQNSDTQIFNQICKTKKRGQKSENYLGRRVQKRNGDAAAAVLDTENNLPNIYIV